MYAPVLAGAAGSLPLCCFDLRGRRSTLVFSSSRIPRSWDDDAFLHAPKVATDTKDCSAAFHDLSL